jgi:hypothetical protein
VTNPLGSALSFITIFGSQLLALAENGRRMFSWNTSGGGELPSSPSLFFNAICLQNWNQRSNSMLDSQRHPSFTLPRTLTKSSWLVVKAPCNYGIYIPGE